MQTRAFRAQPDVDVLEVVLAGPVDDQLIGGHEAPFYRANVRPGQGRRLEA